MPHFQYTAIDARGQQQTGVLEANTDAEIIQHLRAQNLFPQEVVQVQDAAANVVSKSSEKTNKSKTGKKVNSKTLLIFTRQFATLIDAGLPLMKSLTILANQEKHPTLKFTIESLADSVQGGSTFSESLAQHPKVFDKLYINMVKAGELGGVLELVLRRLAEYMEKAEKLKQKVKSAMTYPFVVLSVTFIILIFLMSVVVPKFKIMFEDNDISLPLVSKIVFNASGFVVANPFFLPNVVWLFLLIAALFLFYRYWSNTTAGRNSIDKFKYNLPKVGNLQIKTGVARFCRTLGTLVTSGVPILQALNITKETSDNVVLREAISSIHTNVKEGESMVTPLQAANHVFPPMVVSMVDVGEEAGNLPQMLLKISDVYDEEVDADVDGLTSMLEPLLIVFLAIVVGIIVIAMFLPLLKMLESFN